MTSRIARLKSEYRKASSRADFAARLVADAVLEGYDHEYALERYRAARAAALDAWAAYDGAGYSQRPTSSTRLDGDGVAFK